MNDRSPIKELLAAPGHLALYPALYAIGAAILGSRILEIPHSSSTLSFVALCAHAGYLLDRVKARDRSMDPSDSMSQPARYRYLRLHARPVRFMMIVEWLAALVLGVTIHPALGVFTLLGIASTLFYAGWKPGSVPRLKDLHLTKAPAIALSVVALGVFPLLVDRSIKQEIEALTMGRHWLALLGLVVIVIGDAIICDLDDIEADRAHRTRSVPSLTGSRPAKIIAALALTIGGVMLAIRSDLVLVSVLIVFSAVAIMRQRSRRDWIDARLLPVVLAGLWFG